MAAGYDIGASASQSNATQSGYTGAVNIANASGGLSTGTIAIIVAAAIVLLLIWKKK